MLFRFADQPKPEGGLRLPKRSEPASPEEKGADFSWTQFKLGIQVVARCLPGIEGSLSDAAKVDRLSAMVRLNPAQVILKLSTVSEGLTDLFIPNLTTIAHQTNDPNVLGNLNGALKRFCTFVRAYDAPPWTPEEIPVSLVEKLRNYEMCPATVRTMADYALHYLSWVESTKKQA